MLETVRSELKIQTAQQHVRIEQAPPAVVIPYKDFKRLPVEEALRLSPGTLIEAVKANELFTKQGWLELEKARRALACFKDGRCIDEPIGYTSAMAGKPILVLGDGVHRSGAAYVNGMKVDVRLALPKMPINPSDPIIRLSSLVGRNPAIARIWEDF